MPYKMCTGTGGDALPGVYRGDGFDAHARLHGATPSLHGPKHQQRPNISSEYKKLRFVQIIPCLGLLVLGASLFIAVITTVAAVSQSSSFTFFSPTHSFVIHTSFF